MKLRLQIRNFKSIESAELCLNPGLNILVGPNGAGKTCLLSALKFVRDVFRLGAAQALARSGGTRHVYNRGHSEIRFSIWQDYGERTYRRRKYPCQVLWEVAIAQRGPEKIATIVEENLKIGLSGTGICRDLLDIAVNRRNLRRIKTRINVCSPQEVGRDLFSGWASEERSRNKTQLYERFVSYLSRVRKSIRENPDRSLFPMVASFDEMLSRLLYRFLFLNEYNILPEIARASTEQLPYAQMRPDGGSVSEVIQALANRHYHKIEDPANIETEWPDEYGLFYLPHTHRRWYRYRRYEPYGRKPGRYVIENALSNINAEVAAAVSPITSVGVEIDPTNGRRFVVFRTDTETFYPQEVSDGTMKWLCILVSIFVPYSRVYLLEEPENFLHPWMQQRLVGIMRDQSRQNAMIYVLTSHR
jgi:predicted ATPase